MASRIVCDRCGVEIAEENTHFEFGDEHSFEVYWRDLDLCDPCLFMELIKKANELLEMPTVSYVINQKDCCYCKGSGIVAGQGEYTTEPCSFCVPELPF